MKAESHHESDRTKAGLLSLLFHSILVAFLFFYTFSASPPITESPEIVLNLEWGGGGDNAARGTPDRGQGDVPTDEGQQLEDPSSKTPVAAPEPTPAKPTPSAPAKTAPAKSNVLTSNDPDAAALRRQQEDTRKQQAAEAERVRKQQEADRLAAEAEKKRQQDEYNKRKGKFGDALGKNGGGSGQGNTGKPGNQGVPDGTGTNPFGKSAGDGGGTGGGSGTGTGVSIGGGLSGRKLSSRPRMTDNSQKTGKVMVEVCVDSNGDVVSAAYTLKGSTTNDSELRNKAIQWAKQHKFAPSSTDKECGTFAFNFQLQ